MGIGNRDDDKIAISTVDGSVVADVTNTVGKNRLAVDAIVTDSVNTISSKIHRVGSLLNGSSAKMVVNGSGTPVNFSWSPPTGETWFLSKLNVLMLCSNDPDSDEFGGSTALTNGLELKVKVNGTEYFLWHGETNNIKNNLELSNLFNEFETPGVTSSKWFSDAGGRYFLGAIIFTPNPIKLTQSTGDFIRCKVQDDLTTRSIIALRMGFDVWRFL